MTRDEAKKILGENATEEQVTNLLNNYHVTETAKVKDLEDKLKSLESINSKYSDYDDIKSKLNEIEKANMTEQEKLEEQKKQIAQELKEARIINNTAKAKEILAGENIDDDLLKSLVSDDCDLTIKNANLFKTTLSNLKDNVAKQTKEGLLKTDITPDITNANQDSDVMTLEKFSNLSAVEQEAFMSEHPEEFKNL